MELVTENNEQIVQSHEEKLENIGFPRAEDNDA